jgi:hypothetical protein
VGLGGAGGYPGRHAASKIHPNPGIHDLEMPT